MYTFFWCRDAACMASAKPPSAYAFCCSSIRLTSACSMIRLPPWVRNKG